MEIFVQNLPINQRGRTIKRAIANAIKTTFREQVEFDWQFTKRRDSARLTLPTIDMAQQFLIRFNTGLAMRDGFGAHRTVRFRESRNQPDPRRIEALQRVMQERRTNAPYEPEHEGTETGIQHFSPRQDAHYIRRQMRFKAIYWGVWTSDGEFGQCGTIEREGTLAYNSETGELELNMPEDNSDDGFFDAGSDGITMDNVIIDEILVDRNNTPSRMYFTLNRIPRFWKSLPLFGVLGEVYGEEPPVYRVSSLTTEHARVAPYCTVYAIDLQVDRLETELRRLLKSMNRGVLEDYPCIEIIADFDFPKAHETLNQLYKSLDYSYRISFQMESYVRNCLLLPSEVIDLNESIQDLLDKSGLDNTLRILQNLASRLPIRTYEGLSQGLNIISLLKDCKTYRPWNPPVASDSAHIHRFDITPAAYNMEGPEWMGSNRVLRLYPDHHDYFLKVSFVEENLMKIQQSRDLKLGRILDNRWKLLLENGIRLCGRTFEFLGFSSSSLKEHSVWFLAPIQLGAKKIYARDVRDLLGNFDHIRCPPRLAARIGQTFTTTTHSLELQSREVIRVEDVRRNGYVFSDGVGTMSEAMLETIWETTITDQRATKPVVYQIRLGGAKGVLSLDKRMKGREIRLRPAMTKFEAPTSQLELANRGNIIQFFLNRQLIVLLETLGLPKANFISLQDHAVDRLKIAATDVSEAKCLYKQYHLGKASDLTGILDALGNENVAEIFRIPFFHHLNNLALSHALKQIKFKSRIPVPEDSWVLMGVMDEFDFLEHNEIYVCLRDDRDGMIKFLEGDTLVTRSPALHCGDLQKAYAIGSVDETHPLSALYNCIVFSSRGDRPLPNMLAGGDLDGDLFSVSQNSLLFPPEWEKPDEYAYVTPADLHRPCTMTDVTEFFLKFIINDNLGQICNRHQILADQKPCGARDPDCIELSRLASTAVDFPKTGIPVDLKTSPWVNTRLKPDFMAYRPISKEDLITLKSSDPTDSDLSGTRPDRTYYYQSKKVLGEMYRRVDIDSLLSQWNANLDVNEAGTEQVWLKIKSKLQMIVPPYEERWPQLLLEAQEVFDEYMNELQIIQRYFHPTPWRKQLSEEEVFLQCISIAPSIRSVRGRGTSEYIQGLSQAYEGLVNWVKFGVAEDGEDRFVRLAAYFHVGIESAKSRDKGEGESFAWLLFPDLCQAWEEENEK